MKLIVLLCFLCGCSVQFSIPPQDLIRAQWDILPYNCVNILGNRTPTKHYVCWPVQYGYVPGNPRDGR